MEKYIFDEGNGLWYEMCIRDRIQPQRETAHQSFLLLKVQPGQRTVILLRDAGAVSYTHLDVYKRQLITRALPIVLQKNDGIIGFSGLFRVTAFQRGAAIFQDVYKRQLRV